MLAVLWLISFCGDFTEKAAELDSLWLMLHVIKAMSGVSSNGNKVFIFYLALRKFINTQQRKTENTDEYQQRLLDAYNALKLAGGEGIFRLPAL